MTVAPIGVVERFPGHPHPRVHVGGLGASVRDLGDQCHRGGRLLGEQMVGEQRDGPRPDPPAGEPGVADEDVEPP